MKDSPALARVVGTSHERLVRVDVHGEDGGVLGTMDVAAGMVTGSSVQTDRWTASLEASGPEWIPDAPGHPLSGLSRSWLTVWMGATVDTVAVLVPVARVIPSQPRVQQSADGIAITVECVGPAGWLESASGTWPPPPLGRRTWQTATGQWQTAVGSWETEFAADDSCQGMIKRVVAVHDPPAWQQVAVDSTSPVAVPADYEGNDGGAWQTIADLAAFANVTVFFDAYGRLIIRDPLPVTARAKRRARPVGQVEVGMGGTMVSYSAQMGRTAGFANAVELTFESNDPDQEPIVGRASQTTGPLAVGRGGTVVWRGTRQGRPTQAQANARAQTFMRSLLLAWRTTSVEAVPDPRMEPNDVMTLTLPDRTEKVRVTVVELPLNPDETMRLGLRSYD